jgi:hypothetical protein
LIISMDSLHPHPNKNLINILILQAGGESRKS